jgi:hypothetical protein
VVKGGGGAGAPGRGGPASGALNKGQRVPDAWVSLPAAGFPVLGSVGAAKQFPRRPKRCGPRGNCFGPQASAGGSTEPVMINGLATTAFQPFF